MPPESGIFTMLTSAGLPFTMLTSTGLTFAGLTFAGLTFAGLTFAGLTFAMLTSTTHHFPYGADHSALFATSGWCRNCYTTCAASMFGTARSGISCGMIPGLWHWRIRAM